MPKAYAQNGSEALTLKQALAVAQGNNNRVVRAAIEEEIAREEVTEARERKLPSLDFHTAFARRTNITEFVKGVLSGREVTFIHNNKYDFTLGASLPVYQGNKIKNDIRKAGLRADVSGLQYMQTQKDVNLEVAALYLDIYKLMQLDKLLVENVEEEKERLKEVESLLKHGIVTKNEVLRAKLQLTDRELLLLNNQKDIEVAYDELRTLLHYPEEQGLAIDTLDILNVGNELNFALLQNTAMANEEIKASELYTNISLLDVKNAKANYYPTISLYSSYTYSYPNFLLFPPHWNPYSFGEVGVQLVYDISGLYKNGTKVSVAKKRADSASREADIVADEVHDRIFRQYTQYLEQKDKFKVTDAALDLATENYRLVKLQYLNRLVVVTEMIDADNALLQAKFDHVSARIDAVMKYYELLHTAGISFAN